MHFTRLRLSGFKSFVDPTELVISDGLTGVVGPNGCGKSNLLEAIRWVMGESRPTAMRGGEMEDVIFAGSGTRPARHYAEVTLTLDNRDRLEAVIARARALSPALAGAPVVERWAGLRPRAALPDPMVGAVPGLPGVFVATGGFRTGLATAPAVGAATAALVLGADPGLPETWGVPAHLEAMRRKAARPG